MGMQRTVVWLPGGVIVQHTTPAWLLRRILRLPLRGAAI